MSCCATASLSYQIPAHQVDMLDFEEEQLRVCSSILEEGLLQTSFTVPDMHCSACIGKIERGLACLVSVESVRANLSLKRVSVVWNPALGMATEISRALSDLGFEHYIFDTQETPTDLDAQRGKELLLALAVAGFAAANVMLLSVSVWSGANAETAQLFHLISGLIAVPTVFFAGRPFFRSAWSALRVRRLNMDVPISLAVLLALAMSVFESVTGGSEAYFDAAVTLLFFLLIGRYLDHLMRQKARGAVEQLARMSSKGAMLIAEDGNLSFIPTDEIEKGMILHLKPGERFPVDGILVSGKTDIDRSLVTGESNHITIGPGDIVEAGALNLTGLIKVKSASTSRDSFLAEIQKMMEVAENGRGQYVRIADRMAQIYAPAVHLLALITFITWMVITSGDVQTSLYYSIAVLIITCPCALGLAVPVAHVIGANKLMQQGILMRDGSAIERLAEVDTVAFDKTGTLTIGSPIVSNILGFQEKQAVLYKAMAAGSTHPFSKAVVDLFDDVDDIVLSDLVEVPGYGLEASYQGQNIRFGKPTWASSFLKDAEDQETNSSVAFAIEGQETVIFTLEDNLRDGAHIAAQDFLQKGFPIRILSGDKTGPVRKVAMSLCINDYRSNLTPEQKIRELEDLKSEGRKTLMVGDGINDAPALASAHVSIAPASASDVGRSASDFIFIKPSLTAVTFAHQTAITVGKIIRQNFGIAIAYNCVAVPLAMMGFVTPLIAAIAMSGSSIAVIANSMRINFGRERSRIPEADLNLKVATL